MIPYAFAADAAAGTAGAPAGAALFILFSVFAFHTVLFSKPAVLSKQFSKHQSLIYLPDEI
jgi:hypothetical protein